jgi:hypothetical protein
MINSKKTLELLQIAVKGRENYVYEKINEKSLYFDEGYPSCLVGQIFFLKGFSEKDLKGKNNSVCFDLPKKISAAFDGDSLDLLREIQILQDHNKSWGFCLREAERIVNK